MSMKPWYKVATPREDLREGRPLDAAEFAVHLDHVRDGRAFEDYQDPERFFDRAYLTKNLTLLGSQVLRRLSGEMTETSAVFNMATQFGGGKTHALTLLYHLANGGPEARAWTGVQTLLRDAGVAQVPKAATAVFVGTEFDSIRGRGGEDGSPKRMTPWGEIAFQLGGAAAFAVVESHDKQGEAPGGDVIRDFLPQDRPALVLMDELMNYISRSRKSGLSAQLYDFLHNLSETARGQRGVVLVASIPASELEMTAEDLSDYDRFKKMLDRLGKPVVMSAEAETSEIIRRRLFEWDLRAGPADQRRARRLQRLCGLAARASAADPLLVPGGCRAQAVRGHLPVSSRRALGLRAQVADAAPLPADPRGAPAARPLGGSSTRRRASRRSASRSRSPAWTWATSRRCWRSCRPTATARGVANGTLAYLGKTPDGRCEPFFFEQDIESEEIELSDDMFIVTAEEAKKCIEPPALKYIEVRPDQASIEPGKSLTFTFRGLDQHGQEYPVEAVSWSATGGEIDRDGVFHAREEGGRVHGNCHRAAYQDDRPGRCARRQRAGRELETG